MNHHLSGAQSWKAVAKHPLPSTGSFPTHFRERKWNTGINQPLQPIQ